MLAKKLIAEFVGTFFLVLVVAMTAFNPALPAGLAPIAIASVLATMIFALGHVSGGHFNPIVTVVMVIRGASAKGELVFYLAAQFLAALAAAWFSLWVGSVTYGDDLVITAMSLTTTPALLMEILFTFALVLVILNVATAKALEGNQFFGLAIGLVVLAGAYVAGPVSGGAFNPAVSISLGTTGIMAWQDLWVHLMGQVAGGLIALAVFMVTASSDHSDA